MRTLLDGMDIPPPRQTMAPPAPGYRSAAASTDGITRLLVLAACGVGGLLAVGGAGWFVLGRNAAPVPVIEADSRPVRVKPDNPGGMQIAGAEETITGPQAMAPATEAPAPQALRAQLAQPAPVTPRPAAALATVAVPAPIPAAALVAPTPVRAVPPPSAPVGRVTVQLGALETEAQGRAEWDRLAKRMPTIFASRQPLFQRADSAGHTVWRIRTGGFADMAEATSFCTQVKAKGGACSLAF